MIACVFYSRSPRYITTARAWEIRQAIPARIPLIGIFVDTPAPLIQRVIDQCQLDGAQLFGGEARDELAALRGWSFKGVAARSVEEAQVAADLYLDRKTRRTLRAAWLLHLRGAIARRWDVAGDLAARAPMLLASDRLRLEDVAPAIRRVKPWGLDVWRSIERAPGVLDADRLAALASSLRDADDGERRSSEDAKAPPPS